MNLKNRKSNIIKKITQEKEEHSNNITVKKAELNDYNITNLTFHNNSNLENKTEICKDYKTLNIASENDKIQY